jgi:hypothetical protein
MRNVYTMKCKQKWDAGFGYEDCRSAAGIHAQKAHRKLCARCMSMAISCTSTNEILPMLTPEHPEMQIVLPRMQVNA